MYPFLPLDGSGRGEDCREGEECSDAGKTGLPNPTGFERPVGHSLQTALPAPLAGPTTGVCGSSKSAIKLPREA